MKNKLIALVALSLPLLAQAATLNNLVVNGGFEANTLGNGQWKVFGAASNSGQSSSTPLTGWTVDAGAGIELRNAIAGKAFEGAKYVELDSFGNASMSQQIATQAGSFYELSLAYSPREGVSAASNGIEIWWNNDLLATLTGQGKSSGHDWQIYSFDVLGSGGQDRLRFRSVGASDSLGGSLDSVSLVQQVPAPASLALGVTALALLGWQRRRTGQVRA